MSKPFDMELFLGGVLTGSHATRQRHLRQAKAIQAAISNRWHRDNPWTWQRKHLVWFLNQHVKERTRSTRYYYLLTVHLLTLRLGKPWQLNVLGKGQNP
ncbi:MULTISPECIES: hypothetical protein [unclassified Pseudomonas]|uniref:hypothetical protein n=1 Tax=unclassified Pseudomonas TaxID=196821 RepID=UPI000C86D74D|nr:MULTISPECIES: hypothetical protein [unclassified Pseudomonas]PMV87251.1 hypothetical protein C1X51_27905 [Pseudomonas sp. FW306-2-2C-B10A]PMV89847.1 hypothetical protein C1X56_02075 [Pseudomonas sp. GW101-1A09]PMW02997.1 hypothetical protein C1X55_00125 [Pseudomonas sp. GW460-C8]PMW07575.1 hypothetical protein C1X50_03085 [Pseudomonas sp. MPR-TSA4]PMW22468.1 hypothetical protein C1X52_01460 [Pseudomonas sp. FW306-2-1A-C05A]